MRDLTELRQICQKPTVHRGHLKTGGRKTLLKKKRSFDRAAFIQTWNKCEQTKVFTDGTAPWVYINIWRLFFCLPLCLTFWRRLLTQLEVAKGCRGPAGDSKSTAAAAAKGPDAVVLYELHSRPEQEKFNESAKVTETWIHLIELAFVTVGW